MVALLNQCFDNYSNSSSNDKDTTIVNNNDSSDLKIPENTPLNTPLNNNNSVNVPTGNMATGPSILEQQFTELKDYTRHLEKEVEEYKKYIDERFNDINNQQFHVVEGFDNLSNSKDLNDIIIYLMTCIFVLLLVDYIFKMGKNSY
mgnify:CR=1 FL=1